MKWILLKILDLHSRHNFKTTQNCLFIPDDSGMFLSSTISLFENILSLALSVISILFPFFFLCFEDYFCVLSFILQFLSYHTFDFVQGLIKNIYIFSFLYKKYTRYLLIPCIHCISSFFISHNP